MKIKNLFIRRVASHIAPPKWMASAYFDCNRREILFAIYGLHWIINLGWWLNLKWCRHTNQPSWIDRQLEKERNRPSFEQLTGLKIEKCSFPLPENVIGFVLPHGETDFRKAVRLIIKKP